MMASVNSVSQMANPAARRHRPSQPAVFSNDAALITATHSRPVQYSQDHAYGQEAPTPPVPSSPRGRGLVEPYRPLGPLPPRTVRAVARLSPHPVADGHLVDVAALAAPPCQLAAYGLHAGGWAGGQAVDEKSVKKHRNDVCRLTTLLAGGECPAMSEGVRADMRRFMEAYESDPVDPRRSRSRASGRSRSSRC